MRLLILGSSGFLGRLASRDARARGHEVEGWSRGAGAHDESVHRTVDLLDARTLPAATAPFDAALFLAGHSVPGAGFTARHADENVRMARHAFEWLATRSPGARVVVASSSHVHAPPPDGRAIDERAALAPQGDYGRSKAEIERLARAHAARVAPVIVRLFHQIGPRMPAGLLVPDVLAALARDEDPIRLKGRDGTRDFLDARDGARALVDLATAPLATPATFVLASGRGTRVSDLARGLCAACGRARDVTTAPGEAEHLVGDASALRAAVGFAPRHALADTLAWIAAGA